MKKLLIALCIMLMLPLGMNSGILNEASIRVIVNHPASGGRDHLAEPNVLYYPVSKVLTLEFPADAFEPYTLSVSSMYNTLDFYVTTPFVSVPINDTNITIELQLETASGDMYYGSFEASSNTSTE